MRPAIRVDRSILFAVLLGVGLLNGFAYRISEAMQQQGVAGAVFSTFGVSAVVWVASAIAIDLISRDRSRASKRDLRVAALAFVAFAVPIAPLAWIALTVLSIHLVRTSVRGSPAWRGAWIACGVTGSTFWAPGFLKVFSGPILAVDAAMVSIVLRLPRSGNLLALGDGQGSLWIAPACSSFANLSLAVLAWLTVIRAAQLPVTPRRLAWCLAGCAAVVIVNVVRIGAIALHPEWYEIIHGPAGAAAVGWITLIVIATFGFGAAGVRDERPA